MLIRHPFAFLCAILMACAAIPASAQTPVPVEAFFQNPAFSGGKLSPSGRHLAIRVAAKNGRYQLVVLDVEKLTAKSIVAPTDADVDNITWISDDRLVFSINDKEMPQGQSYLANGLYAVSRDGSDYRQLVDREVPWLREIGVRGRMLDYWSRLLAPTYDVNSDDVFVTQMTWNNNYEFEAQNVLRLNTKTGQTVSFQRPGLTWEWVIDHTNTPRVATSHEKGRAAVHVLGVDGKWESLSEFDAYTGNGFTPVAMAPDGSLYVRSSQGGDTASLYRYDVAKKALDPEPIVSLKGFDFNGSLIMGPKGLVGVRYVSDAAGTIWFDPQWKAVQARVDALLPNTVNLMEIARRPEVPFVLVHAYSDVDPGRYILYNYETGKQTVLGAVMRDIEPRQMATRDFVRYKARDGLEIPGWLTVPRGSKGKKLPLVVLVHGGPWVRGGQWNWDADSQFLASRGFAVLEPEFRGSAGFGWKHFRASWKQWGLAMQDDIADGARWAVQQGIADPARICIAGASYGGYSALMGLLNDPDVFKCGVNWVGVTDISLLYEPGWGDFSMEYKAYGMPRLVGHLQRDADQLSKTSPLVQAARIKQPLLLAYGGADRRVQIVHGTRFRDAVQKTNPDVEWVEYLDEGHGWQLVKNRVDFWTRVDKFLQKNIGQKVN
ncbi:MAG: alpha/beta fold hydrolase [Pseudomonadota bacterium]